MDASPLRRRRRVFTRGQLEVIRLIACGHSQSEAADAIGITAGCISESLRRASARVGARSTAHLIALAVVSGQVSMAPIIATASLAPVRHG